MLCFWLWCWRDGLLVVGWWLTVVPRSSIAACCKLSIITTARSLGPTSCLIIHFFFYSLSLSLKLSYLTLYRQILSSCWDSLSYQISIARRTCNTVTFNWPFVHNVSSFILLFADTFILSYYPTTTNPSFNVHSDWFRDLTITAAGRGHILSNQTRHHSTPSKWLNSSAVYPSEGSFPAIWRLPVWTSGSRAAILDKTLDVTEGRDTEWVV